MDEWVEIVKTKANAKVKLPPDGVNFSVKRGPKGSTIAVLFIGPALAAKLCWEAGRLLRCRWATGGASPRLKVDTAPAGHPNVFALRLQRGGAYFALRTAALPEGFVREALPGRIVGHEAITDRAKPQLSELIVRLPVECMTIGKKHAA